MGYDSNIVNKKLIPISKPIITEEAISLVSSVLRSGNMAQGEKVEEFERCFAEYIGTKYAIATSSGTTALHLALKCHGIGNGDEVITTPFTFIATANSILYCGAAPVFVDIDDACNINPNLITKKITSKTKAILCVHLYGQPCDMKPIMSICKEHNLTLIEDTCQAHGAEYQGRKAGSFGTGCFSFYPTKNMTAGEGGMITTNNKSVAESARILRNHGQKERYLHEILGYNYRMTEIAAAIGICQLRKLEQFNSKRIENAKFLTEGLTGVKGLGLPYVELNSKHVFHQYTVRITGDFGMSRDELKQRLLDKRVETSIYYPTPIHKQPLFRKLGYDESLPNSERAAGEVLSLPVHPALTKEDMEYIVESLIGCQEVA